MMTLMKKCVACGKYTLKQKSCPYCGGEIISPHPPKFSPEDKYAKYRRKILYS
ncbi:MAG: RNA-protein complex protein Nop10 [Candidatus Methanomethylicia archaeon]